MDAWDMYLRNARSKKLTSAPNFRPANMCCCWSCKFGIICMEREMVCVIHGEYCDVDMICDDYDSVEDE